MSNGKVTMTSAGRILESLDERRERAVASGKVFCPLVMNENIKDIRKIIRRQLFFSKKNEDLVDLVDFCGNAEFFGHKILSKVLVYVLSTLTKDYPVRDVHFELCWAIMYSPTSVNHYLSTSNVDKFVVGNLRLPDVMLDWLGRYIYRVYDVTSTHHRFLAVLNADSLRELLKRCAWPRLAILDAKGQSKGKKLQVQRNCLVLDLLYLCLLALYCQVHDKSSGGFFRENGKEELLNCLTVILRAVPKFPLKQIYARASRLHFVWNTKKILNKVLRWSKRNGLLVKERLTEVPSLKSLAKNRIRSSLYSNWALPEGLDKLNLPQPLVSYLDLEYD